MSDLNLDALNNMYPESTKTGDEIITNTTDGTRVIPIEDGYIYKVMSGTTEWSKPCKDDATAYFIDWFTDNTDFESKIHSYLEDQGYLTEGDIAKAAGIESALINPFIYYYGDVEKYRKDMRDTLDIQRCEFDKLIAEEYPELLGYIPYKRIKALLDSLGRLDEYLENGEN